MRKEAEGLARTVSPLLLVEKISLESGPNQKLQSSIVSVIMGIDAWQKVPNYKVITSDFLKSI